ncbi:MAG: RluA family pseudouridine synthase, partial [Pseudomonadota bacterium]
MIHQNNLDDVIMNDPARQITIHASRAGRLDHVLCEALTDVSRMKLARLIADGQVLVDGVRVTRPGYRLKGGERILLMMPEDQATPIAPSATRLDLFYEDAHIGVVNKPAGMVVHPGAGHHHDTLAQALINHCGDAIRTIGHQSRPGIVHRLDKDTSGVMVFAKTQLAYDRLAAMFAAHDLERRYLCICTGLPAQAEGTIRLRVARDPSNRLKMMAVPDGA